jgi:PmbA protein
MNEDFLKSAGIIALEAGIRRGVMTEVYLLSSCQLNIEVADSKVETLIEAKETGMGIRIVNDGKLGFAYTCDLSAEAILEAVNDAYNITSYTSFDKYNQLPVGPYEYEVMQLYDQNIKETTVEEKIDMARQMESVALAADKRISIIERAGYEDTDYISVIMNTNGLYASGQGNFSGMYIYLVAEENGDAQTGFAMSLKKWIKDLDPEAVAREAAKKAVRSLNARTIKSANLTCIMEPYVVTQFLGVLAKMVDAGTVQKGKSLFAGRIGQAVASEKITLIDDSTWPDGAGSFPFDGEGVPAQSNLIIENGILKTYLYDTYTAAKDGVSSTGNAQRGSFRSLPEAGPSNFIILPGSNTLESLISDISKGFYITDVMGMHTTNPISGDFSVGAAGIMIENGYLAYPVRGVTIAGNLIDLLQDIDAVGNDLKFYGSKGAPAIRLKNLCIGGE